MLNYYAQKNILCNPTNSRNVNVISGALTNQLNRKFSQKKVCFGTSLVESYKYFVLELPDEICRFDPTPMAGTPNQPTLSKKYSKNLF
jgi:hypothetical protein